MLSEPRGPLIVASYVLLIRLHVLAAQPHERRVVHAFGSRIRIGSESCSGLLGSPPGLATPAIQSAVPLTLVREVAAEPAQEGAVLCIQDRCPSTAPFARADEPGSLSA